MGLFFSIYIVVFAWEINSMVRENSLWLYAKSVKWYSKLFLFPFEMTV